jgi:hypothetical protein
MRTVISPEEFAAHFDAGMAVLRVLEDRFVPLEVKS